MRKLIKKNQKICMVPNDIKGALSSSIKKVSGKTLELEIDKKDLKYYKKDDIVEMFTVVEDGMLYFKPVITDIVKEEALVKLEFDKKEYDLLQRREYTRIELDKEFKLKDKDNDIEKEYTCKTLDISAGGMKIVTQAPLIPEKDYLIEFSLESNIPIKCFFKPIRVNEIKEKGAKEPHNLVSGRFIALKNIDKIAIVQFCFKKQMENTNK